MITLAREPANAVLPRLPLTQNLQVAMILISNMTRQGFRSPEICMYAERCPAQTVSLWQTETSRWLFWKMDLCLSLTLEHRCACWVTDLVFRVHAFSFQMLNWLISGSGFLAILVLPNTKRLSSCLMLWYMLIRKVVCMCWPQQKEGQKQICPANRPVYRLMLT
jgi:hypothetical protein